MPSPLESCFTWLPGIGAARAARLAANRVTSWDQLDAALGEDRPFAELFGDPASRRGGATRPRRSAQADEWQGLLAEARSARAARDWGWFDPRLAKGEHWRLLAEGFDDALYLDIETTGLSRELSHVTVVGVLHRGEFFHWVWPQPTGPLFRRVAAASMVVTFNGRSFDLPYLEHHMPGFPSPPAHVDLLHLKRAAGIAGGLKALEVQLGLARDDEVQGMGGAEAVWLWYQARAGDDDAMRRLLAYNRADVEMLPLVAAQLIQRLAARHPEVEVPRLCTDEAVEVRTIPVDEYAALRARGEARRPRVAPLLEDLDPPPVVVGVELSEQPGQPGGWARCIGQRSTTCATFTDADLLRLTLAAKPDLVVIDAPLSLPRGRAALEGPGPSLRAAEKVLQARRVPTLSPAHPDRRDRTRRAMDLACQLRAQGLEVVECLAAASQGALGLPRQQVDRATLQDGLARLGLKVRGRRSLAELEALTAALTGLFYLAGRFEALGDPGEGAVVVPQFDGWQVEADG